MTEINYTTLQSLEDLLDMETGYVLDFTNSSFERFIKKTIDINIYEDEGYENYSSKANKLRDLFDKEPMFKVTKLIKELLNYYKHYKLKLNDLTEYDKNKINEIKSAITKVNESHNKTNNFITKDLDKTIQMISTRQAYFNEMSLDEKLKEIGNLIEHLLKKNGKYREINYYEITLGFINDNDVKDLRGKVQCFRHSSSESLNERNTYTKAQKQFMVEYGIVICELVYSYLKN